MAAISVNTFKSRTLIGRGSIVTFYGTGASNQSDTFTTVGPAKNRVHKLAHVIVAYSAAPTQAGVTVSIDSGLGASFDTLLNTGSANAQYNVYIPAAPIYLTNSGTADAILVSAPAGGSGITATVQVVLEED